MINYFDPTTPTQDNPTGSPKLSTQEPKAFLLAYAKRVQNEVESMESRVRYETAIQMCRRHRGITPSDRFGYFTNGIWAESPKFANLHGTNIFQSLIRGAEANYYEARIQLDISAKAGTQKNRSVERISRSIYEILDTEHWTPPAESDLFYGSILKLNAYAISRFNKSKAGVKVQKPKFSPMGYEQSGTAICPDCYSSHDYTSQTTACPECGGENLSVVNPPNQVQDYAVSGFEEECAGETETIISNALEVSVDDRNTTPADIKSAGWVEWRCMAPKAHLQQMYNLELKSKPTWSLPTRLLMGLRRFKPGEVYPTTDFDKENYEVRHIWMDPAEYQHYRSDKGGKVGGVELAPGEGFIDKFPKGMIMGVVNDEIAFVDGEDKNRRVKSCVWIKDAASHYGLGAQAGLPLQKKINQLETVAMEGEARSLKGSLIYNPEAIDGAHLEGQNTNIPLRPEFAPSPDSSLKDYVMPLDVSGLSMTSLQFLNTQVDAMQKVMGVPDVTLGEGDPASRTAAGQSLIDRNATGLLIPAKRSEGALKVGWLFDQLDLIQTYYSAEAVKQFGARYGKEWLDDEVQAFLEADLDDAITICIVAGSEIPESRFDKQQKLRQDIATGFVPMTPEIQNTLARESGYEGFDVGDYSSNEKIAEKRYHYLKNELMKQLPETEQAYEIYEGQMTDPKTGQRAMDGMGNKIPNPVITQLLTSPVMEINKQAENHEQHYMYWSRKCRELQGSAIDQPRVLIAACDAMMTMHNLAIFETQTKKAALGALTTAPMGAHDAMVSSMQQDRADATAEKSKASNEKPKPTAKKSSASTK